MDQYDQRRARQALEDIGKVDAAGSIATRVVVPIPAVVGMTSTVGDLASGERTRKRSEKSTSNG